MVSIGTPFTSSAIKVVLLGSGELGKEVVIELQRFGCEVVAVDAYPNAPAMQVSYLGDFLGPSLPWLGPNAHVETPVQNLLALLHCRTEDEEIFLSFSMKCILLFMVFRTVYAIVSWGSVGLPHNYPNSLTCFAIKLFYERTCT